MSKLAALRDRVPAPVRRLASEGRRALSGRKPEWEYLGAWPAQQPGTAGNGWNDASVLETYRKHWPSFLRHVEGVGPMGFWYEVGDTGDSDLVAHNIYMSYAYALGRAAYGRAELSLLDWGGGIGHYYLVSKRLMPELRLEYHCKDVPVLAEHGKTLFPEAHFYADASCLERQYDFVLASGSMHYSEDWRGLLERLARATRGYCLLTRMPIVQQAASFAFVQRPYRFGYQTEYSSWCLNQSELLAQAAHHGLELVHAFVLGEAPEIVRAPEQNAYRGFLFKATGRGR